MASAPKRSDVSLGAGSGNGYVARSPPLAGKEEPKQRERPAHRRSRYRITCSRVNEAVLAEVRAIGATTASPSGVHERDTVAARVADLLAGPDEPERRREFVRWAERTAVRAPTAEMRSAARLLLALVRDGASPAVIRT